MPSKDAVVIMGVAGCGKSALGSALALRMSWTMLEGDHFHSEENRARMQAGVPLTDAHREGWLRALAEEIRNRQGGVIVTCSALKRTYRDMLREASPDLRFIYLEITPDEALRRVSRRAAEHFFPPRLLQSQFDTLEPPVGEPDVLCLEAARPIDTLAEQAAQWLAGEEPGA